MHDFCHCLDLVSMKKEIKFSIEEKVWSLFHRSTYMQWPAGGASVICIFFAAPVDSEKRSFLFTSASDTSHYCRNQFVWRRWNWSAVCRWRFWVYLLLVPLCSFHPVPMDWCNCLVRSAPRLTLMARAIIWSQPNLVWVCLGQTQKGNVTFTWSQARGSWMLL